MKSYLEIQVPLNYDSPWFVELRNILNGMPVKWQIGYFHITMAFINETPENIDLRPILEKYLTKFQAPSITFDKLDAFTTYSGMFIVHLTSTIIPDDFLVLTEAIRSEMKAVGCQIDSEFSRFGLFCLTETIYIEANMCGLSSIQRTSYI